MRFRDIKIIFFIPDHQQFHYKLLDKLIIIVGKAGKKPYGILIDNYFATYNNTLQQCNFNILPKSVVQLLKVACTYRMYQVKLFDQCE